MKPSARNIRNEQLRQDKLAAGKPLASRYERKQLTADELHAREHRLTELRNKGVTTR